MNDEFPATSDPLMLRVLEVARHNRGKSDVMPKPTDRLIEDLHYDSLLLVEFVMALEDAFEIEIHDEDAEKAKTIQEFYDVVKRLTSRR